MGNHRCIICLIMTVRNCMSCLLFTSPRTAPLVLLSACMLHTAGRLHHACSNIAVHCACTASPTAQHCTTLALHYTTSALCISCTVHHLHGISVLHTQLVLPYSFAMLHYIAHLFVVCFRNTCQATSANMSSGMFWSVSGWLWRTTVTMG